MKQRRKSLLTEWINSFPESEDAFTPLHFASFNGNYMMCTYLIELGADPYIENDLGMNAFDMCNNAGPFPSVHRALLEHVSKE